MGYLHPASLYGFSLLNKKPRQQSEVLFLRCQAELHYVKMYSVAMQIPCFPFTPDTKATVIDNAPTHPLLTVSSYVTPNNLMVPDAILPDAKNIRIPLITAPLFRKTLPWQFTKLVPASWKVVCIVPLD